MNVTIKSTDKIVTYLVNGLIISLKNMALPTLIRVLIIK